MYAYFVQSRTLRPKISRQSAAGMPLLRVDVSPTARQRTLHKLTRTLRRRGVHQLLNQPDFSLSIPLLSTAPLWRTLAPRIAEEMLAARGLALKNCTVGIHCSKLSPEIDEMIRSLAPRVRGIGLSGMDGDRLFWCLQREMGLAPYGGKPDITLCYVPKEGGLLLPLWPQNPAVAGLEFSCDEIPPLPNCPHEALLCALLVQGRIHGKQIKIHANFP